MAALGYVTVIIRGVPLRSKTSVTGSLGGPMHTVFPDIFGDVHSTMQWQVTTLNVDLVFTQGLDPLDFMNIREEPCQVIMDTGQVLALDKVTTTGEVSFSGGEDGTLSVTLTGGIPRRI